MIEAARILRIGARDYAVLMAQEMGKPLKQGIEEAEKCAWVCEYYAHHAEGFLKSEPVETETDRSYISFSPLGLIFAVMPWNFPFWQVFRSAAPALMAGNGCLLKHASNVSGCALQIEDIFRHAGFPKHLFRTLIIPASDVEHVIENPFIRGITLTGSTAAGREVAQRAGRMLKKTVMELGGSDPYLVLHDADLESAVALCVKSRLLNSGQSCIAAKRFIVVEPVLKDFETMFTEEIQKRKIGNPLQEDTEIGPLARKELRQELDQQVQESIDQGARPLLGAKIPAGKGFFYPATVLTNVARGMPVFEEETFGPIAAITPAKSETEAIELANCSLFGLGAAVFTRDKERGERIASRELQAGSCFVNDFVKSDPRFPFGGIKESGYGRELSHYGIKEFVNIKTVRIR
jgi:succinate-semialdehyde dehydrogenase/glutarate-semialdehyde dehydrogenase